jgi:hypothetical protein
MARWEIICKHELKATEQRVQELKEKMEGLKIFDTVLDNFEFTGVGEVELLTLMENLRPLP